MSSSDSIDKNRFEDIWQGILPGLEPLPPAVVNYELLKKQQASDNGISSDPIPHRPITAAMKGTPDSCTEPELIFLKSRREQESDILRFYQTLIKNCSKRTAQELVPLERLQKQVLSRLVAVYFLKTGERGKPCSSCPYICSVPHAIRNLCNEEAAGFDKYTWAASEYSRIKQICEEIAQIKAHNTHELEMLLGRVMER